MTLGSGRQSRQALAAARGMTGSVPRSHAGRLGEIVSPASDNRCAALVVMKLRATRRYLLASGLLSLTACGSSTEGDGSQRTLTQPPTRVTRPCHPVRRVLRGAQCIR